MSDVRRVGVIGAGTMGNGIAHVFARRGFQVVLCDVEQRFLDRGMATIDKNLEREVSKNKMTANDRATALKRIETVLDRGRLADCDFVIEAATEKFEIKAEIFRDLDRDLPSRGYSRLQYFFNFDHQTRGADQAARASHRHALLQSCAGDEAGGGDSRPRHVATRPSDGSRSCRRAGKDASGSQRCARLRLQPRADASAERGHVLR